MKDTRIRHEAPTSLAAFRRILSAGAVVYLSAFEYSADGSEWRHERHKYLGVDRVAERVNAEFAILEGGSRLTFGKASEWTFTERPGVVEAQAAVVNGDGSAIRLTYIITA